jgi:hypothetical protein
MLLFLPRSPLPWLDEIFFASTSLSVVRGGTAVPTVLAAFPQTHRADLFYGPVTFFLGSFDLRLFGLSLLGWRLLGFAGAIVLTFAAAWVSRCLHRSPTATAASAMFVVLSQGMGARATSGRIDTVTVAIELLALGCGVCALQTWGNLWSQWMYAGGAGFLSGLAALSTPRSFPFLLGFFIALAVEIVVARTWNWIALGLVPAVSALLPIAWWTIRQGTDPLSWLRFVLAASRGDTVSVSPMLQGSWHLFDGPLVPRLSGLLVILMMFVVFGTGILTSRRQNKTDGLDFAASGLRLASITVMVNYLATLVVVARFWDYEVFVVPLLLPVLIPLSARVLRTGGRRTVHRLLVVSWLALAILLVFIRAGKIAVWLASYQQRDARPLLAFVEGKIPKNSRVFGPDEYYFYAVESAGSHYLFVRAIAPNGLVSKLYEGPNWRRELTSNQFLYLIWPTGRNLPHELTLANLQLQGSFIAGREGGFACCRWLGGGSGYPPTTLYRIISAPSSDSGAAP